MADAARIIGRIRSHGANIVVEAGKLRVINRAKLPDGAIDDIKAHSREVAKFLDDEMEVEERAAIIQFDGGLTRPAAEYLSKLLLSSPPSGADRADWTWFVAEAAKIVDHAIPRRAA